MSDTSPGERAAEWAIGGALVLFGILVLVWIGVEGGALLYRLNHQ